MKIGDGFNLEVELEDEINQLITRVASNSNVINNNSLIENPDKLFFTLKQKIEKLTHLREIICGIFKRDSYLTTLKTDLENTKKSIEFYNKLIDEIYSIRVKTIGQTDKSFTIVSIDAIQSIIDELKLKMKRFSEEYNDIIWEISIATLDQEVAFARPTSEGRLPINIPTIYEP